MDLVGSLLSSRRDAPALDEADTLAVLPKEACTENTGRAIVVELQWC